MGTIANKLNKIKNTKDKIKTITNLSTVNTITSETVFKDYPKKILKEYVKIINNGTDELYTNFPKVEDEGTKLELNTEKGPLKITLEGNTSQDGTPTPDNPVDVKVITGDNNIKIADGIEEQSYPISLSSKNLFDLENENFIKRIDTTALSILSDGFTVNKTDALLQERITVYKQLKPNTTYTISTTPTEETGKYLGAYLVAVDEISTSAYPSGNAGLSNVATTNSYGILAIIFYFSTSLVGNYTVKNIQLEEGSTATTYEPYYNIEYCKIGDYADQIFKNTIDSEFYDSTLLENEWYLKKNIGKKILDNNNIIYAGTWLGYTNVTPILIKKESDEISYGNNNDYMIYCNKGYHTSLISLDSTDYIGAINTKKQSDYYWLIMELNTTVENARTILGGSPFYFQYKIPQYIHITETDYPILREQLENLYNNAKSYSGTTIIECSSLMEDNETVKVSAIALEHID